jgi:hypothetical protein
VIGKGRSLKSWKDVKEGAWLWVQWPAKELGEIELRLQKVEKKIKGGVMVKTESGALMEITNPKACMNTVGEP